VRTSVAGEAILNARSSRGLTQHQLARAVGIAGGERVSEWERGVTQPRARLIPQLAGALGVPPKELLSLPAGVDLRALRLIAGRSAPDVATAVNVSVHTYLRWEVGERLPLADRRMLVTLSRVLGAPLAEVRVALARSQGVGQT
jgi:transcriptional regulator with XRE-family HTH domain